MSDFLEWLDKGSALGLYVLYLVIARLVKRYREGQGNKRSAPPSETKRPVEAPPDAPRSVPTTSEALRREQATEIALRLQAIFQEADALLEELQDEADLFHLVTFVEEGVLDPAEGMRNRLAEGIKTSEIGALQAEIAVLEGVLARIVEMVHQWQGVPADVPPPIHVPAVESVRGSEEVTSEGVGAPAFVVEPVVTLADRERSTTPPPSAREAKPVTPADIPGPTPPVSARDALILHLVLSSPLGRRRINRRGVPASRRMRAPGSRAFHE